MPPGSLWLRPFDRVLVEAVREALKRHKQIGNPIVEWRNGQLRWIACLGGYREKGS